MVNKILVVGAFGSAQRDEAIARGFRECGVSVEECGYGDILYSEKPLTRLQLRFAVGPVRRSLVERVRRAIESFRPEVIFFRRPLEFTPPMLRALRRSSPTTIFASFNNDDPFSPAYTDRRWRLLREAIPLFDVHFSFRERNLAEYEAHGAKHVALWEPFYSPWLHRPLVNEGSKGSGDVLFAMHTEHDGRREAVLRLRSNGIPVRVHSWNWASEHGEEDARRIGVLPPIWGDDYVRAVGEAMATLCFFSKQNRDELTSRIFEIPACGGLLVAERNSRLREMFKEGEEAVFFGDIGELVQYLRGLRDNPTRAAVMRHAGQRRLLASRYSVVDRCADALGVLYDCRVRMATFSLPIEPSANNALKPPV